MYTRPGLTLGQGKIQNSSYILPDPGINHADQSRRRVHPLVTDRRLRHRGSGRPPAPTQTVALALGGLALGMVHTPFLQNVTGQRPDWLTPEIALVIFLPPPLFEGSVKIQFWHPRENFIPILLLANMGVLVATIIIGFVIHWEAGLLIMVGLLFGVA